MHFKTALHCVSVFFKAKKHSVWTAFIQLTGLLSAWTPDLKTLNLPQPGSAYNYHGQMTCRQNAFLNERLSQNVITSSLNRRKNNHCKGKVTHSFQKNNRHSWFKLTLHNTYWKADKVRVRSMCTLRTGRGATTYKHTGSASTHHSPFYWLFMWLQGTLSIRLNQI